MIDHIFITYAFTFIEGAMSLFFFSRMLIPRFPNKSLRYPLYILSLCAFTIIVSIISNFDMIIKIPLVILIVLAMSILNFKDKLYTLFFFSLLCIYILLVTDIVVCGLFAYFMDTTIENIIYASSYKILLLHFTTKLINLILFLIFSNIFKKVDFKIPSKYWLVLNVIMLVNLILSIEFMSQDSGMFRLQNGLAHYIIFSLAFLFVSILVLYFFIEICVFFQKEKQFYIADITSTSLNKQITVLNAMVKNIKKLKHDMKNNLLNISILIKNNQTEDAVKYIDEYLNEVTQSKNAANSGNTIIDAIINCKLVVCESNKIDFFLKIEPIPELNISYIDITTILSNIIDNAIEASLNLNESDRMIALRISKFKGYVNICIKNKYNKILRFENGFIKTSKPDTNHHGFGIALVQEAAEKNQGIFNYSHNDNIFKVTVMLPIKDSQV